MKEQKIGIEKNVKGVLFCPYCGMSVFELSGDEGELVFCEYCGIDVNVQELIP